MGKDLYVDLSRKETTVEKPHEDLSRKFIGGLNLATKILYDEVEPGINPLGPENRLIFVTSPLMGTLTPTACQYSVVAKSIKVACIGQAGESLSLMALIMNDKGHA